MDLKLLREVLSDRTKHEEAVKAAKEIVAGAMTDADSEIQRIAAESVRRREQRIAEESATITAKWKRENRILARVVLVAGGLASAWLAWRGEYALAFINAAIAGMNWPHCRGEKNL